MVYKLKPIKPKKPKRKLNIKKPQGFVEFFFVIVVLLAVALFLLVLNKVWKEVKNPLDEGLSSAMPNDSSVNVSKVLNQTGSTTRLFDKLLPFILIGLFAFVLITAGAIMRHPIMIFVGVIILAVIILLAVIYSNLYQSIAETNEFQQANSDLPIQGNFMKYLPYIIFILALGITIMIVYGRNQGGGGL